MSFVDVDLEKLFTYGRFLLKKLPRKNQNDRFQLGDGVSLEYYRLQKVTEQNILMESAGEYGLDGISESGKRVTKEEKETLSEIVNVLNKRFGTEFTEADKLFLDYIQEELVADDGIMEQTQSNTMDNFKFGFKDAFMDKLIARMEQNKDIFSKMMDDKEFGAIVMNYRIEKVYKRLSGL